jgi:SAM-dependent methyltransferase
MKPETIALLLNLNREFYDAYAQSFSSTRYTIQPGIRRLLPQLLRSKKLLDFGCGNGNLAQALLEAGFTGTYLGIDNSTSLLESAKNIIFKYDTDRFAFRQIDLSAQLEPLLFQPDTIVSFAVIHHFPALSYLDRFFEFAANNLGPKGKFYLSTWQVKNSPRLKDRIQPWSILDIDAQEVTEDDLLLDWRADPTQQPHYRYVHHYDPHVLKKAGISAGLKLENEFYSDGKEGDLALYQVWQKASA